MQCISLALIATTPEPEVRALAGCIALVSDTLVLLLRPIGWATFAAAILPVLVIGLNWRVATA